MKVVLDIKPELLTSAGDCQSISLMKLFQYYGKTGFEHILKLNYDISFCENGRIIGFDEVETFDKLKHFNYKEMPNILSRTFNVKSFCIHTIFENKVMHLIDQKCPLLIEMTGTLCPWIDLDRDGYHFFLITGYDNEKRTYICVDPYFSDDYVHLPFDVIYEANSKLYFPKMEVYDFSDFTPLPEEMNLYSDLRYIREKVNVNPASEVFGQINRIIQSNQPGLNIYNVGMYALSNNELLPLTFRFSCLSTFFIFLFKKYKEEWLLKISNLYTANYKAARSCMKLFLRYVYEDNQAYLLEYLDKVYSFKINEKHIEEIILTNLVSLYELEEQK